MAICCDGTQTEAFLSKEAANRYGRGEENRKAKGPSVVAMLVQLVSLFVPNVDLADVEPMATSWVVPPFVLQDEKGSTLASALFQRPNWFDKLVPIVRICRYSLVCMSMDSAASNGRGSRIFLQMMKDALATMCLDIIIALHWQRCDGHQGHIVVRKGLVRSNLLPRLFSLAHLMRHETYRSRWLSAISKLLMSQVVLRGGDPPPECREYLLQWFVYTILRAVSSAREQRHGDAQRGHASESRRRKLWTSFETFAVAFNGFVSASGVIIIYTGARFVTKAGVVQACTLAMESLFFSALPGVPAENRWTSFCPFLCWVLALSGLLEVGGRSFLWAFAGDAELDADVPEADLDPEQLFRVQQGKRMRNAKAMFRDSLQTQLRGLATLAVAKPLELFMHMMIRDVGAMHYFDWRARERAMGREWRRTAAESPFYIGLDDDEVPYDTYNITQTNKVNAFIVLR